MNIQTITLISALAGVAAHAQENAGASPVRQVTVCVQNAAYGAATQARGLASDMFAAIGVNIDWRQGFSRCPQQSIMISFTDDTPTSLKPGALAYALPYEGTHIRVFHDRIAQTYGTTLLPPLMAHVFVHEISHILEGVSRHSASGIMKAHWGAGDFSEMRRKHLEFADEDIDLIYRGLAARATRAVVAINTAAGQIAAQ